MIETMTPSGVEQLNGLVGPDLSEPVIETMTPSGVEQ